MVKSVRGKGLAFSADPAGYDPQMAKPRRWVGFGFVFWAQIACFGQSTPISQPTDHPPVQSIRFATAAAPSPAKFQGTSLALARAIRLAGQGLDEKTVVQAALAHLETPGADLPGHGGRSGLPVLTVGLAILFFGPTRQVRARVRGAASESGRSDTLGGFSARRRGQLSLLPSPDATVLSGSRDGVAVARPALAGGLICVRAGGDTTSRKNGGGSGRPSGAHGALRCRGSIGS